MTARINVDTSNANLPSALPPHDQLLALSSLVHWWSAEEADVTVVSNNISAWADKVTENSDYALTQATDANRAAMTVGGMSDETAATFDAAAPDIYGLTVEPTLTGTHTLVVFYKPSSPLLDASRCMVGKYDGGTARYGLWHRSSGANAYALVGDGFINFDMVADVNNCTMLAKNASTMRVRHNGVTSSPVAHNETPGANDFVVGAASLAGSSPYRGAIGDIFFFDTDIVDGGDELTALAAYALEMYGVTV